jgi:palmitoyl-protein thioesterase
VTVNCPGQDPYNLADYLARNVFLPDLNNEGSMHPEYGENLAQLERLALFRFSDDFTLVPRDSAWFAAYFGDELVQMKDTDLYKVRFLPLPRWGASKRRGVFFICF